MSNIHRNDEMAAVASPGHFNDPDMLQVSRKVLRSALTLTLIGQVGNVGLTVTEQYAHMSLWCIAGAPLLVGTDLIHATNGDNPNRDHGLTLSLLPYFI